jgi:beta,beta-carotene 9',10'-dioxygenase
MPVVFDPETLETQGVFGFDARLDGQVTSAHPHYDFARRCQYSYMLKFARRSLYRIIRLAMDTGQQESVAELPVDRPAYMHSFGMTARYLVLTEFPLIVDPLRLRFSGRPFIENYRWEPDRGARFHVIDKESGRLVRTATADPCFAFHHVNAFEEDDRLVIDIVTFPDARIIQELYLDRLRAGEAPDTSGRLMRFELSSRGDGPPTVRPLAECPIELPRINHSNVVGRSYRFVWGTSDKGGTDFSSRLAKVDVATGQTRVWEEAGCHPGEPIFVAAPSAATEDDGLVLSVVLDARKSTSFLLALDAASLTERARAEVPHHIPFDFHGNFLSRSGEWPPQTLHR